MGKIAPILPAPVSSQFQLPRHPRGAALEEGKRRNFKMCVSKQIIHQTISQPMVTCAPTSAAPAPSPLCLSVDNRDGEEEGYEPPSSRSLALCTKSALSISPVYMVG